MLCTSFCPILPHLARLPEPTTARAVAAATDEVTATDEATAEAAAVAGVAAAAKARVAAGVAATARVKPGAGGVVDRLVLPLLAWVARPLGQAQAQRPPLRVVARQALV